MPVTAAQRWSLEVVEVQCLNERPAFSLKIMLPVVVVINLI